MKKPKIPKKFKLDYLREIDRNLVLHCMQPFDTAEGYAHYSLYHAPSTLLARIVHTLDTLTGHYKHALKIRTKVERKVHRKKGLDKETSEAIETIRLMGGEWNTKGTRKLKLAVRALEMIHKKLKGKH